MVAPLRYERGMAFTPQTTPMIIRSLAIAAALALASPALAQNVASFVVANDDGYGVDTCLQSGSDCGQPGGESSHFSCRPSTVQSSKVNTVSTASNARSVVK